ncbi:hypothetical protein SAMN05421786_1011008 [Chryseobacterium ureilyticum]|uniref:Uncharacterized protein n=1 Tax=Chryseobacterium ureilyticum TaxID=373668 RepID=A0A1N7L4P8_9FLAO|nr:hypothetical protein [Chryseobacterium ureilyticum]SIS68761.1 hypothetical protein SAMN05421786_1011008 [Chryseobacterium ureilyticum]
MKKSLITTITLFTAVAVKSQVAIGKQTVSNTSVSIEFANDENRGLILPYVENKSSILQEGTIIYDTTDYKVKYLKDNGQWVNLSEDDGTMATIGTVNLSVQGTDKTENTNAKTTIGKPGATNGIFVLEALDKAMILPKVTSPHLNIIDPAPGMMVYDTVKKQLAVYNGKMWSFWKP